MLQTHRRAVLTIRESNAKTPSARTIRNKCVMQKFLLKREVEIGNAHE